MTRAVAAPNFALVKYWGKSDDEAMMPAVPSLSITLDGPLIEVTIEIREGGSEDVVTLEGRNVEEPWRARTQRFLDRVRQRAQRTDAVTVSSAGGVPPAAGLASSAAYFGALARAASHHFGLSEDDGSVSDLARRGSISAARSVPGGLVVLDPLDAEDGRLSARSAFAPDHWDLAVVVAVVDTGPKDIVSSDGMRITRQTSPYYGGWVDTARAHLDAALEAIEARDIEKLGVVAESSCLKMHASAMAAQPPIIYFAPTTLEIMKTARGLRGQGLGCFYTVDAGPQVKVVCLKEDVERVREGVQAVPGVQDVLVHSTGTGCRLE